MSYRDVGMRSAWLIGYVQRNIGIVILLHDPFALRTCLHPSLDLGEQIWSLPSRSKATVRALSYFDKVSRNDDTRPSSP